MRSSWNRDNVVLSPPKEGFRRFMLTISYDGNIFCGWQRQNEDEKCSKISVQNAIENAIFNITGERVVIYGSGRTDSGVHALAQVAHFDSDKIKIDQNKLRLAINANLPQGVRINDCCERFDAFHARYSTYMREYLYLLKSDKSFTAFDYNRVWNIRKDVDIDILNSMASLIVGEDVDCYIFDFTSASIPHSTFRDILVSKFFYDNDTLCYSVVANAFLYHQVRAIVGTFIDFYRRYGSKAKSEFQKIIKERKRVNFIAPACGLYLKRIIYSQDEYMALRGNV